MAQIKTANFLPEVFRTDTNQKFLNATLDQLVTQPDLRNINGYVGRKFAPTFKSTDNYVPEPNAARQNYQLEPSVVVKNKITGKTEFFSSYIDLLNQVAYSGGITTNQTRLFANESYSYDGLFDFDKFVNFNQYYWLENGPDAVLIYGNQVPTAETFTVIRDTATGTYTFTNSQGVENPSIRLAYGGVYKFVVNQLGYPFWIQTNPGVSGTKDNQTNLTGRDVLGVTNNGTDVGTVTFNVPQPTAQDFYVRMPLAGSADFSTALSYTQVQGQRLSAIKAAGENGFDGISAVNQINLKALIFVNTDLDDVKWTVNGSTVPVAQRRNAWQITLNNDADPVVTLNPLLQAFTVGASQKVFVKGGQTRAEYTYYLNNDYLLLNLFKLMPDITAPLSTLYYQDGVSSSYVGKIDLLEFDNTTINVDIDIVGKPSYASPNGVKFTNGLKVTFDASAVPSSYAGNTYYVEGVGTAIQLLPASNYVVPETYAANGLVTPDYITINRASIDLNPWTRSNRWFHVDVINATAAYNGVTPLLDQNLRANRPIIEFEADVQLYNFGRVAKAPVDILDFTITDSRNKVELQPAGYSIPGATVNGYSYSASPPLAQGMRIVFANDFDPTVRDQIFVVNIVNVPTLGGNIINLVPASDNTVLTNNNLLVIEGATSPTDGNTYYEYWYNGGAWVPAQAKTAVNQTPMFDVIDNNGVSLGTYTNSTFATTKNNLGTVIGGTALFSYKVGTGVNDPVLGFPLSYRNFNQIGDIQFANNFDTDAFSYTDGNGNSVTGAMINTHGTLQQNTGLTTYNLRNSWTTNVEESKQFQIISGIYDGVNPYFQIDIIDDQPLTVPYFRVYKNALATTGWEIVTVGVVNYVYVTDSTLTTGDEISILIYNSTTPSNLGYYEVPKNLDYNSQNANFSSLTLGQLRNHVSTMVANSNQVVGNFPGNSNLRDLPIKAQGGSILQHASPVLYSELFLVDENANFLNGLNLARHEYSKFKNKILELSQRTQGLDYTNIPVLLDTLLKNINAVKNKSFAWYYSDMVPYGDIKNTITYTVLSAEIVDYEISNIFSDTTLSNQAVLVYKNNVQLTKGIDYRFDTNRSGVSFLTPLTIGDVITINEYSNTDGNYIPETPSKLGLYPKFTPEIYYDTTYTNPIYVIQGHDGSITPSFGDYRDQLLLEFEKRIYNNIKVDYVKNVFDIYNFLPGKFRTTDYSNNEFTQLLTDSFLTWVGGNRIDYITNNTFVASEPFTWNYNKFVDVLSSQPLPGYWRGIYKYFYDTDRPHTNPWEMVGFSEQPTWWAARYGSAPYTGGNMVLWDDMAAGVIWNNGAPYVDTRFVRPNLQKVIPVDYTGNLLPPDQVLVKNFNSNDASGNFKIGDQGPAETAWRRSSDFPYAMQQALALSHPAFYFGTLMDIGRYYKNTALNQYVLSDTLQRVTPKSINVNGTTNGGTTVLRAAGYVNWIAEYLRNQGIDPGTKLYEYFDNVNIQLAYKMAGFTDQTFIQVLAEQSSPASKNSGVVIPNESYAIELYKSTPTKTITYSGVVVEKTATGFNVSGFDVDQPYFTIIPSLANNRSYGIPVLNDTAIIYQDYQQYKVTIPYGFEFTNKQQVVDFLVSYQRYLRGIGCRFTQVDPDLGAQRDWLLSVKEFLTWAQQGWQASSVLVLSPTLNQLTVVTNSGVVDMIQNQPGQSRVLDTNYNFIKYSQINVNRSSSTAGNTFSVTANGGQTLSLVKLSVVEYEHIMIFDNIDIFNDVIYVPELGNRQYRLKLVGKKTGSWTGAMNPPGFVFNNTNIDAWQQGTDYLFGTLVNYKGNNYTALQDVAGATAFDPNKWAQVPSNYIKTGLLPNFTYNAEKFNRFNDVDNPEVLGDFHLYSDSAIGFQPRDYMTNFGIDEITQAKFYQGFIREKGSLNSIYAFTAAGFNNITSDISVYEEWGMRVGEYGALNNNRSIDLVLTEGTFNGDPVTFTLLTNNGSSVSSIIGVQPNQLYRTEGAYTPTIYLNRDASSIYENDIQTAGYVDINDVTTTVFDISTLSSLAQLSANVYSYGIGSTIWTAADITGNWNVYRITETDNTVNTIKYSIDNIGTVATNKPHGLMFNDNIMIRGFDPRVDGFYRVYNVINAYTFSIVFYGQNATQIQQAITITGDGPLYKLQSVRIDAPTDLNSITPAHGWINNDKLWVDVDDQTGGWVVYNKSTPWSGNVSFFNPSMTLNANSYATGTGFGTVTAINAAGTFAAAGLPTLNMGNVIAFVANVTNGNVLTQVANIGQHSGGTLFGASLATAGDLLYIGNPGTGTQYGCVHIHQFNGNAGFPWTQTLSSPWTSNTGDAFGTSIDASADGTWLYVAAPNAGNVYVYQANATSFYTYANTITVGSSSAAQFGYKVKTTSDGRQVAISAPYQAVNGVSAAGAVYVFDRSVEAFIANGTSYTTQYTIGSTSRVTVNGNIVTTGYAGVGTTTLTFTNAPVIGSLITVETNKIQLLETLTAPTPKSGAAFGTTTYIAGNDADVYVASPGYSIPGYYSGIVYRFVNQGASYGTISSTNYAPVVNTGDNFRINGFEVVVTGNTVANVAAAVNSANIPGVSASTTVYNALTITSNVVTEYQRLVLSSGSGTLLANLGMMVYNNVQTLQHPETDDVSEYGIQVLSSPDSGSLVISASGGSTQNITTFDVDTTTFDNQSILFLDTISGSGIVYVYGLVNGTLSGTAKDQYVLVQRLQNNQLSMNDQFGYSVAMNNNTMLIGAPGDSNHYTTDPVSGLRVPISDAGTYYTYNNFTGNVGWDIVEQQEAKVDINSVSRMYLYNANTNVIITNLDYIDPAKGKILGAAQEDLDYITAYDPASYNAVGGVDSTLNLANGVDHFWGPEHVTKTWWNTGAVRYLDYEQGNLTYRANNWGATFPGSKIQVCEWVASSMPPNLYPGPGTALYPNNTAYSMVTTINPNTKMATTTYYYWVTGKDSIEPESVHINTISTIQNLIANPQAQGIAYAAVLRDDTISLHGISNYLTGNSTVFHADYDTLKNTNIIHSEYQLVQEGNASSPVPKRIVEKLVDSLSGIDFNGAAVPDSTLAPQSKIGLGVYPNQTLFVDRTAALKNWVEYVNAILIQYPIVEEFNISGLYQSAPLPDQSTYDLQVATYLELGYVETNYLTPGYVALVTADETQQGLWATYTWNGSSWISTSVQSYYTPFYWSKTDWYDSTYDSTVLPTYVVNTTADIAALSLAIGNTVKVLNNGNSQFVVYRVNSDATTSLVGIQQGTIQLNSNLYTTNVAGNEIRIIFETLQNHIFIDTLKASYNEMFFFLINYILTEQPNIDWAFKTSFITILHQFRTLDQPANYVPDNQTYYEQYINEVKPYRTSIREYLIDYQGNDEYRGDTTDFDIPSTYIADFGGYRSPNGTNALDNTWLSTLPQYNQWYNNHTYGINSVIVANAGGQLTTTLTVNGYESLSTGQTITQPLYGPLVSQLGNVQVMATASGTVVNGLGGNITVTNVVGTFVTAYQTLTTTVANFPYITVGNVITQPSSGASGNVLQISGNTIALTNVVGTFTNSGNTYIFNNGANLQAAVTTVNSYRGYLYANGANLQVAPTAISVPMVAGGYTLTPTVTVTGGGGTGAKVQAVVNFGTGVIETFEVINPGSGYTSQPEILINGTGTGAAGYAQLNNHYMIESLPTTTLTANSNVTVYVGNIISQANTNAYGTVYTASTGNVITLIDTNGVFNTTDYIYSDAANLNTNVTTTSSFTQFVNQSYNTVRSLGVTINFDRVSYGSNIVVWQPNITVANSTVVSYNGQAYQATSNVYSTAILTLSGNISASIGNYITQANTTANAQVIAISSNLQLITVANLTSNFVRRNGNIAVNGISSNVRPVVVNNLFDYTKYTQLTSEQVGTAADRVTAYYEPTAGMPAKDLTQLMSGVEYPGVTVEGVTFEANSSIFSSNLFYTWANTSAIYSANVIIPSVNLYTANAVVVYTGNVITQATTGATGVVYNTSTGNVVTLVNVVGSFDNTHYIFANSANLTTTVTANVSFNQVTNQNLVDFTKLNYTTGEPLVLVNRDTSAQYQLTITEVDPWRIIVGGLPPTTTLGSNLSLKYYDYNNPLYLDSTIYNTYTNSNSAINLDGGAYYDTYSGHAPEELIPGVTYDNLNMLVTTKLNNGLTSVSYRIVHNMGANATSTNTTLWPQYYGVSASHITTLRSNLNITDANIYVTNASALTTPNPASLVPGVVYINGEKIVFWGLDPVNNVLFNIRRAVDGTGAANVYTAGTSVVEAGTNELIPGGNVVHTTTWLNLLANAATGIADNFGSMFVANLGPAAGNIINTTGPASGAVTDGTGLGGATTVQAQFIKNLT